MKSPQSTMIPQEQMAELERMADEYLHPYTDHCGVARYCIHDILSAHKAVAQAAWQLRDGEIEELKERIKTLDFVLEANFKKYIEGVAEAVKAERERVVGMLINDYNDEIAEKMLERAKDLLRDSHPEWGSPAALWNTDLEKGPTE